MRVLLDNCVTRAFAQSIPGHDVIHVLSLGWGNLSNGLLLDAAEREGFEVLVTVDRSMRFQQNFSSRRLALVVIEVPRIDLANLEPVAGLLEAWLDSGPPAGTVHVMTRTDL